MLAESGFADIDVLKSLNSKKTQFYFSPDPVCKKIQLFTKFKPNLIRPLQSDVRFTIRKLFSPVINEFNLMIVHYQSKVNWTNEDQAAHIPEIKRAIEYAEKIAANRNTIVCGDFNMNPFDLGMIQTTGFHSVMDRNIALSRQKRIVDGKEYRFMYNPMWSFLGDKSKGNVAGTIYHSPAKPISYHWNMFDQVLMSTEMIPYFDDDYIDIVTKIGSKSLLNRNNLIDDAYSDHLPIKFRFNI